MDICKKESGNLAEKKACDFLQKQGLQLITQNFRCRLGEVDLIMRDQEHIVFVEVRSRSRIDYGTPIESVTVRKQTKILKTSIYFLQQRNWLNKVNFRFDIIGVNNNQFEWIKNAFTADIMT